VRAEEIEHRAVRRRLGGGGAQGFGAEAGQIEEAVRPGRVAENPRERPKGNLGATIYRIFMHLGKFPPTVIASQLPGQYGYRGNRVASLPWGRRRWGVNAKANPRCRGQRSQPPAV